MKKIKIILTAVFFLTATNIFAETFTTPFTDPANYTFDSSKIEIVNGKAQLRKVDLTDVGANITASSTYSANEPKDAFDDNITRKGWGNGSASSLPAWLRYDFGAPQIITSYSLYRSSQQEGGWNNDTYAPKTWTLEASNDASSWVVLDTQTNNLILNNQPKQVFNFTNTTPYRYYRINIIDNNSTSHSWVNITEMEFFGFPTDGIDIVKTAGDSETRPIASFDGFSTNDASLDLRFQISENGTDWMYWNAPSWEVTTDPQNTMEEWEVDAFMFAFPTVSKKIFVKTFLNSKEGKNIDIDEITIRYTLKQPPSFESISLASNNAKNSNYAKEGDNISMTLELEKEDIWKENYNKATFSIGDTAGLQTPNYSGSTTPKYRDSVNYTVQAGENGNITFTALDFQNTDDMDIVNFISPYNPNSNITVDTISPNINFTDDVETNPASSESIRISVEDTNPDMASYEYGYSPDSICDFTDTYGNAFTTGLTTSFTLTDGTHNGEYICVRAEDMAGNVAYKASANPINIEETTATPTEAPDLDSDSDTGVSDTDNLTYITQPTITGACIPRSEVKIYIAGTATADTGTCTTTGNFEIKLSQDLADGDHDISFTQKQNGPGYQESNQSPTLTITMETVDPTASFSYNPSSPTNGSVTVTMTTSEEIQEKTGWTKISDTEYTKVVTQNETDSLSIADMAGNKSLVVYTVDNIDTAPPTATVSYSETNLTNQDVIVTMTTSEEITTPAGWTQTSPTTYTKTVSQNETNTFNIEDLAGNTTSVSYDVANIDKEVPVIILNGSNPQEILVNQVYTEEGASCTDNSSCTVSQTGTVDTTTVGTHTITYTAIDPAGNTTTETRIVNVVAGDSPVITLNGDNPQNITAGNPYTELGATANDTEDGDLTGSISIDSSSVDTQNPGTYTVTYTVTDSSNNTTSTTREVQVTSNTNPIITLNGSNPQEILVGQAYTELGATANDAEDGDLTSSIVIDATAVDTTTAGSYTVTYTVTDNDSNTVTENRTVNVTTNTSPVITLSGSNPQTIILNQAYTELGATANDAEDGDLTSSIVIDATAVDITTQGSYTVTYTVTDNDSNTVTENRTVNVVSGSSPVITLTGANPQILTVGDAYTELGANANDPEDGDLTSSITTDSSAVNTTTAGSYTVNYTVSDSAGNTTTETRTVIVQNNNNNNNNQNTENTNKKKKISSIRFTCKDKKATNYDPFGRHKSSLCKYVEQATKPTNPTTNNPFGGNQCPAHLLITDNMKKPSTDGRYSSYNKGIVTQVKTLQLHMNRLLLTDYGQQASGPVDGYFRKLTETGVKRLQMKLNTLLKGKITPLAVDGIVGPFTKKAINMSC